MTEPRDLLEAVALKPNRLDVSICLQIRNLFESFVVQIELRVYARCGVLSIELTECDYVVVSHNISALLVLNHCWIDGWAKNSSRFF